MPHDRDRSAASPPGRIEHKAIPFEVKAVAGGDDQPGGGSFSGLGGCFWNLDSAGDVIVPGAFAADLPKFLSDGFIGGINHDWDAPIGHPVAAEETPEGLMVTAVLDDTPDAQAIRAKMRVNPASGRATIRKLSIGFRVTAADRPAGPDEVKAMWKAGGYEPSPEDSAALAALYTKRKDPRTGKESAPGVRAIRGISLYEISPVAVPANDRAAIIGSKFMGSYGMPAPMGGPPDPEHGPLGDTDDALAWSSLGRLHDLLCMALYGILCNEMAPLADRLALMGEAVDQFRAALLDVLGYFLADDVAEGGEAEPAAGIAAATVEAMSKRFKSRFGLADPGDFAASLAAASAPGFSEQSRLVVSAVGGFVDRADARADARQKDGRELSAANRAALTEMRDGLHAHATTLTDLLARTDRNPAKSSTEEAAPPIEPPAVPPPAAVGLPPGAKRVDPATVRGLINRFVDTNRAASLAPPRGR